MTRISTNVVSSGRSLVSSGRSLVSAGRSLGRLALGASFPLIALLTPAGTAATSTGCGDSDGCISVRAQTYAALEAWQRCNPGDTCIVIGGNPHDCTGVLTCDFPIVPKFRAQAETAVLAMGEQSKGCNLCAVPNCVGGTTAYCEPVSGRCISIPGSEDSGAPAASLPDGSLNNLPKGDGG